MGGSITVLDSAVIVKEASSKQKKGLGALTTSSSGTANLASRGDGHGNAIAPCGPGNISDLTDGPRLNDEKTVWFSELPKNLTSKEEVRDVLEETFGEVVHMNIMKDLKFGFAHFAQLDDAKAARAKGSVEVGKGCATETCRQRKFFRRLVGQRKRSNADAYDAWHDAAQEHVRQGHASWLRQWRHATTTWLAELSGGSSWLGLWSIPLRRRLCPASTWFRGTPSAPQSQNGSL